MSFDFKKLKENWGSPIVARTEIQRFTGGIVHGRTIANMDALGTGPKERIRIGRKVAYPVDSIIEWLQSRVGE